MENEAKTKLASEDHEKLEQKFKSVGLNLIVIRPDGHTASRGAPLTVADAEVIRRSAGKLLIGVAPVQQRAYQKVSSRIGDWNSSIVGCTPDLQQVRNWKVAAGRFLTADDLKKQSAVCLIGQTVRKKLFTKDADPLRELIRVGDLQLQVVAVLEEKGRGLTDTDQDDQILMPLTTLQQKLVGEQRLSAILAAARSVDQVDQAVQKIAQVLREQHRAKDVAEDFEVSSVLDLYRRVAGKRGTNADKLDK